MATLDTATPQRLKFRKRVVNWLGRAVLDPLEASEEIKLVAEFFGDRRGFFVEVGAFDPIAFSQTWHLELRGWTGLLVEPTPEMAGLLRSKRTAQIAEVACGSPAEHGTRAQLRVLGVRTTIGEDFLDPGYTPDQTLEVSVVTLDSLLIDAGITRVDFLSIDVEGHEVQVLEGFALERYRPSLVLMEDFVLDRRRHRHMKRRGYRLVRRTQNNSWYVPRECDFYVSLFGRLQLFRKYTLGVPIRVVKRRWQRWVARRSRPSA
jgi:FkbM family methyltransferase